MQLILLSVGFIILTVTVYFTLNILYVKFRQPFLVPLLTTTIVIILILLLLDVSYDTYMLGGMWIDKLVGPAIVALAIPLYKQKDLLKQHIYPILSGVLVGGFAGMITGLIMAKGAGFSKELVFSVLPKSITTPIAMQIAEQIGGIESLAAVFVMIAGVTGVIFSEYLFKIFKLDSTLGRGIGLGVATHGIGIAKAIEYGEEEASISSVAMSLSAIYGSLLGPIIAWVFYM